MLTTQIAVVLLLLVFALVLFATERIPIDIVTIILVTALVLTGTLTTAEAFSGFGNDIVITIAGLFILTGGLVKTGVIDIIGRRLHRIAGGDEFRLTMLVMFVAAACASVMKNTTTTAMFIPVVLGMAERSKISPSKLLMPLAFGAILGGTCTLIGTSTNLAVSAALTHYGLEPYSMFELTMVGIPIVIVGMLYMLLLGLRLLPARAAPESLTDEYHIREYMSEVLVLPDSPMAGRTLGEARFGEDRDLTVLGIMRGKQGRIAPESHQRIAAGDLLLVQGRVEDILRVKSEAGIEIKPDFKLGDGDLEGGDAQLTEAMVLRGSDFLGRTLKGLRFRQRFQLTVLAVYRQGVALLSKISTLPLRFGDVLLIQGRREQVEQLAADGQLLMLEDASERHTRAGKRLWAIAAFMVFLALSVTHLTPLSISVMIGVFILLASRAVRPTEIYNFIDWRLIVLIAGMLSFGIAMEKTQADQFIATLITDALGAYGAKAVLAGFFLMTVVLTQPMSNQAAALVMLPIAIKTAMALGLNPRTFAITITYAASCSFVTPLEPACVLVFTPGRYKFIDFVKVGSPLTIAVFAIVMWLVPIFWPLQQ
jgi:di/tricarboxylate transporter